MPESNIGINSLRSLIFIREYSNLNIKKTGTGSRARWVTTEQTAPEIRINPKDLTFRIKANTLAALQNRSTQDHFIDLFI